MPKSFELDVDLGSALRHTRITQGLTIDQVSKESLVSKSAISLIENGERIPEYSTLQEISKALNTKVHAILVKAYMENDIPQECWDNNVKQVEVLIDDMKDILFDSKTIQRKMFQQKLDSLKDG